LSCEGGGGSPGGRRKTQLQQCPSVQLHARLLRQLIGYLPFPYAAQVFCLHRFTTDLAGIPLRAEVVDGIPSLSLAQADPARLLGLARA
jgi:hypothetical protein